MKIMHTLLLASTLGLLAGCQVAYDISQNTNQHNCQEHHDYQRYKQCMDASKTTYEQYKKERDELVKKPSGS